MAADSVSHWLFLERVSFMGRQKKVLLFAGTSEGRAITEYLAGRETVAVTVCVASEYGRKLLPAAENIHVHTGRLSGGEMAEFMRRLPFDLAIDATHPYAEIVSENIRDACLASGTRYLRVLRKDADADMNDMKCREIWQKPVTEREDAGSSPDLQQSFRSREYIVNDIRSAADFLDLYHGQILLTTGSKDLAEFMKIRDASCRVYVRILPDAQNVEKAASLGVRADHLFCMQGPFGIRMNRALIRHILDKEKDTSSNHTMKEDPEQDGPDTAASSYAGRMILVTKESGKAGGFTEKIEAAALEGIDILIIRRPKEKVLPMAQKTTGSGKDIRKEHKGLKGLQAEYIDMKDALCWLSDWAGFDDSPAAEKMQESIGETAVQDERITAKRCVYLVGAGLCREQLTAEALTAIRNADLIAGAESVVRKTLDDDSAEGGMAPGDTGISGKINEETEIMLQGERKKLLCTYDYRYLTDYLMKNPDIRQTAVLFSGDIGFFSGAVRLREILEEEASEDFDIRPVSGISSAIHFLDRIGRPWQDVKMVSLHGKKAPLTVRLAYYGRLLAILGSKDDVSAVCHMLIQYHMEETRVWIGSDLMQEGEIILSGIPADFIDQSFSPISLIYLEWSPNRDTIPLVSYGLPDTCFVRGRVPMTKEQIRSSILSRLRLHTDSVLYDIGAGTGSVSVEAARIMPEGRVIAIEKKPEGIALIKENAERFHTDNLQILEGFAPDCLYQNKDRENLPVPTHAFIGGSSGNMKEIVRFLKGLNPSVRIVTTAVTLETIALLTEILSEEDKNRKGAGDNGSGAEPEILQIAVSRSAKLGSYHMMKPEDPVYLLTF